MSDWPKRRKISSMPGVRVDPTMVLARSLEKAQADEIEAVAVVIKWKDGSHSLDWSQMRYDALSHMSIVLMHEALHPDSANQEGQAWPPGA